MIITVLAWFAILVLVSLWCWACLKIFDAVVDYTRRNALQPDPDAGPADPLKRRDRWGGTHG